MKGLQVLGIFIMSSGVGGRAAVTFSESRLRLHVGVRVLTLCYYLVSVFHLHLNSQLYL